MASNNLNLFVEESIENLNENCISEFQDFIKQKKLTSEFYPDSPIKKTKLIQYSRTGYSQSFFKNLKLTQEYDVPPLRVTVNMLRTKSSNSSLLHYFFRKEDIPNEKAEQKLFKIVSRKSKEKKKYECSSEDEMDSEEEVEILLNSLVSKVASEEENIEKISETIVKKEFELLKKSDALEEEVKLLLNLLVAKTELEENKKKNDKTILEDEVRFLGNTLLSEIALKGKIEQKFHENKISHFLFESPLIPKSEKDFLKIVMDENIESNKISEGAIKFRNCGNIDKKKSLLDVFFETSFSNVSEPHVFKEEERATVTPYLEPSEESSQKYISKEPFIRIIYRYRIGKTLEVQPWSTWCNNSYDFPEEIQSYYQMNGKKEKSLPKAVSPFIYFPQ